MTTQLLRTLAISLASALFTSTVSAQIMPPLPPPPPPGTGLIPPMCDLGPDIFVPATAELTEVTLSPTAFDPDGNDEALQFAWSVPSDSGAEFAGDQVSSSATILFPAGSTVATLQVTDESGLSSSCEVVVTVTLPAPPILICEVDPEVMWPPNHKLKEVTITARASSEGIPSSSGLAVTCLITSNEEDQATPGDKPGDVNGEDGYSAPVEIELTYEPEVGAFVGTAHLRAERLGSGTGREYTILCSAQDPFGQSTEQDCLVFVPHDRSQGIPARVEEIKEDQEAKKERKKSKRKARKSKKKKKKGRRKK